MSQRGRVLSLTVPGGQSRVYTVSQLTNDIKNALEDRFGVVIVQGEVTSLRHASSGHSYFCLKDAQSQISVVLYADRTTTAIRNTIQEGIALQVEGDITVFPKRGEYQIRALRIEPVGYGALQAQFEALKRKLEGEGPAQDIAQALARMNAFGEVEVIVVGRGGGSPQDLWAFNEEAVVRAIVRSRIPVVSAVGHEVDVTLADLAADVRAATPTHAAQIVVKDVEEIRRTLLDLSRHARERIVRELREAASRLRGFETHHALRRPQRRIEDGRQELDRIEDRLSRALGGWVGTRRQKTELLTAGLLAHAPSRSFERARDRIEAARRRAAQSLLSLIARRRERIETEERLLDSFDHPRVLERGYALVWSEEGARLLKRGTGVRPGDSIEVQFFDARAGAKVTKLVPEGQEPGKETS